ncbi:MAG TPA: M56 family metallopeptidase [Gemmatimonadota bacterium]|nr:M56 family metallopeptidase [Gemmatimonadota bacterium]
MEPVLLDMALKGAAVLALTGAVAAGARSASAAARHFVWSIGLAAVLALPLLQWLLPDWSLAILPARQPPTVSGSMPAVAGAPDLPRGLGWLWLAGTAATLGAFLVGRLRVRWVARAATPLDHGPWAALLIRLSGEIGLSRRVRLLRGPEATMPMMWGIVRPTILLPRGADAWSPALQRDVMLHELAHVQRHDYLTQMVARLACALHWFDPLAWLAVRRMRLERERACDDRVVEGGSSPCDYAEHLLAVARWRSTGVQAGALGMAGSSPLGERLRAVLEPGRTRRRVPLRAALGQTAAAALLVVPPSALHPERVSGPPDARHRGGVLPVPPSASAGLRPADGSREASARTWRKPATDSPPAPAKAEKRVRVAPRSVAPAAPPSVTVVPISHAGATRLLTRARVETGTEICTDSKPGESGGEIRTRTSRTTLAAVRRPVMTP